MLQRTHKIRLAPNNSQVTYFKKACGVKRFTYNWALAEWRLQYAAGLKPSAFQLKKEFNAIKAEKFPFVLEVTKCAAECAFANLDKAFKSSRNSQIIFFVKGSKVSGFIPIFSVDINKWRFDSLIYIVAKYVRAFC